MSEQCRLVLETGECFEGFSFGAKEEKVLELVFNTSMVGYQEIISDPSYTDQAVVMTYPLIGNYGVNDEDFESANPTIGALVVREYNDLPSNFRASATLGETMAKFNIAGIYGVDTRAITRIVRDKGSMRCLITGRDISVEESKKIIESTPVPRDSVSRVSTKKSFVFDEKEDTKQLHVVAIDCGMKGNIPKSLNKRNIKVTIVPFNTPASEIEKLRPDGVFISNGPGDPTDVKETIETVKNLKGKYPIFGICLGHQILSLSYGAKTYKLKFGHRGGNHPVKNLLTDKIEVTSQNHSYAVDKESVRGTGLEITHLNLLDDTVEGVRCVKDYAFSVQYHPESAPGPEDSAYLFDEFVKNMNSFKEKDNAKA
ncbi:MAG: glutamine-hydrolyzing carbamoyl-phosphate synthase small subunit [Lachnospiraceae bacterium]|nr:glutamine-hydrolyzing carbamoyl-phosphate synthase small subunit [Lachnospiraceae bacterium]